MFRRNNGCLLMSKLGIKNNLKMYRAQAHATPFLQRTSRLIRKIFGRIIGGCGLLFKIIMILIIDNFYIALFSNLC